MNVHMDENKYSQRKAPASKAVDDKCVCSPAFVDILHARRSVCQVAGLYSSEQLPAYVSIDVDADSPRFIMTPRLQRGGNWRTIRLRLPRYHWRVCK